MLEKELNRQIVIRTQCREEMIMVANKIHNQLLGNPDYLNSSIVVNMSPDRDDGTENEAHIYIFNDAETEPSITI